MKEDSWLSQAFVNLLVGGPWGGDSHPRKRIPFGSQASPSLVWPVSPLLAEGFFLWEGGREGRRGWEACQTAGWQWVSWSGTHLPPPPTTLPQPDVQARSSDPQLGPDPQAPSPSTPGLVGAAENPLAAARFFAKKGKDATARAGEHLDPIPSMNGSWPRLS